VLRDHNEDTIIEFFRLLLDIVRLNTNETKELFNNILLPIAKNYSEYKDEDIVSLVYDIIMFLYDNKDNKIKNHSK